VVFPEPLRRVYAKHQTEARGVPASLHITVGPTVAV
jgi:hypothetical protein